MQPGSPLTSSFVILHFLREHALLARALPAVSAFKHGHRPNERKS
jgi:hypothetical protein